MNTTISNHHTVHDNSIWSYVIPFINIFKTPLRLIRLLDTLSFRPVKRVEIVVHLMAVALLLAFIFDAISNPVIMAILFFIVYTLQSVLSELEWHRISNILGDRFYTVAIHIGSIRNSSERPSMTDKSSDDNSKAVANDPYKINPTFIDLAIRGGIAFATKIVKIGRVRLAGHPEVTADEWYENLWKEITVDLGSRGEQLRYSLSRCYEASLVVLLDGPIAAWMSRLFGKSGQRGCHCGHNKCTCSNKRDD